MELWYWHARESYDSVVTIHIIMINAKAGYCKAIVSWNVSTFSYRCLGYKRGLAFALGFDGSNDHLGSYRLHVFTTEIDSLQYKRRTILPFYTLE